MRVHWLSLVCSELELIQGIVPRHLSVLRVLLHRVAFIPPANVESQDVVRRNVLSMRHPPSSVLTERVCQTLFVMPTVRSSFMERGMEFPAS